MTECTQFCSVQYCEDNEFSEIFRYSDMMKRHCEFLLITGRFFEEESVADLGPPQIPVRTLFTPIRFGERDCLLRKCARTN